MYNEHICIDRYNRMLIIKILFATHMNRFLCKERIVESMEEPTDNEKTYRKKNFFQQPINIIKQIVRSFFPYPQFTTEPESLYILQNG